jgi:hypothetical protein
LFERRITEPSGERLDQAISIFPRDARGCEINLYTISLKLSTAAPKLSAIPTIVAGPAINLGGKSSKIQSTAVMA